ncbi:GntR family transcriptional regulator [Micromonospora sp. WMMD1102]|uniref:GntR family transcriptional regulator n=1 Tax=Micromonospora sp. WMMD1102 TaxID=3016105 RepID=UPI0024154F2E|nr:GntR family transcriptional regulator [Micromonospora sp. WMMD1102]MDG4791046.1 GntR family transcriptional regulator [Micromonospora sp. WMMD1102]MDG4792262.1 GntR family transcriptional regulator [Micromonospora sp. WMMD1102]
MPTPHRQPRYRAIADELRRRIAAGAIPAGALIPSESALTAEFHVARGTIREAINVIRSEGLVVTEHGRGTYARPDLPVRRLAYDRYQIKTHDVALPGQLATTSGVDKDDQVDAQHQEIPATPKLAQLFGVEPGRMLLERRLLTSAHAVPQQLTTSYYLLDMVAGTTVFDPSREPWPGGHVAQLRLLGVIVTKIQELVRTRMPTGEEADALRLPPGAPIIAVTRRTMADVRVVEVACEMAFSADRTELEYEIYA